MTITDVIRDGTFSSSAPIPLNDVEAYTVPSEPGLLTKTIADVTTPTSGGAQDPSDTDAQPPIQLASAPEPTASARIPLRCRRWTSSPPSQVTLSRHRSEYC